MNEGQKKLRRRVEDALRKTATEEQLVSIAELLGVNPLGEFLTDLGNIKVRPCGCGSEHLQGDVFVCQFHGTHRIERGLLTFADHQYLQSLPQWGAPLWRQD